MPQIPIVHYLVRATALIAISAVLATAQAPSGDPIAGDVDQNGDIGAVDAQAVLRFAVGLPLPTGFEATNGDANCDGSVSAVDAQIILSKLVDLDVSRFCVGQPLGAPVGSIEVSPASGSLSAGGTLQLGATVFDESHQEISGRAVLWSSSDEQMATVSQTGLVSAAKGGGEVTISARAGGRVGSATLLVHSAGTGGLALTLSMPPASDPGASVLATGPGGFSRAVSTTSTLDELTSGVYTITGAPSSSGAYMAAPATQEVSVGPGKVSAAAIRYVSSAGGAIFVTSTGIPAGVPKTFTARSASVVQQAQSDVIANLSAGRYGVHGELVLLNGRRYFALPDTLYVDVTVGTTAAAAFVYVAEASLTVVLSGVPPSFGTAISVTGPRFHQGTVSSGQTLSNLAPGTYTIDAPPIVVGDTTYVPAGERTTVALAGRDTVVRVSYQPRNSGAVAVHIQRDRSAACSGTLVITSKDHPELARRTDTSAVLVGLTNGTYVVEATPCAAATGAFLPRVSATELVVTSTDTASVTAVYAAAGPALVVQIAGLPDGVDGNVSLTDALGTPIYNVTRSTTLISAPTGPIRLSPTAVTSGGTTYVASQATANIPEGSTSTVVAPTIVYTPQGTIAYELTLDGLPAGSESRVGTSVGRSYPTRIRILPYGRMVVNGLPTVTSSFVVDRAVFSGGRAFAACCGSQVSVSYTTSPGVTYRQSVAFAPVTTRYALTVNVTGLPAGASGDIVVTGPDGYFASPRAIDTLMVFPATYDVRAREVSVGGVTYLPGLAVTRVNVTSSNVTTSVTYAAARSYHVNFTGALPPSGMPQPEVTIHNVDGTTVYGIATPSVPNVPLKDGDYWATASVVTAERGDVYLPRVRTRQIAVGVSGGRSTSMDAAYELGATMSLSISGVPPVMPIVGASGPTRIDPVAESSAFHGLLSGTYTVYARVVQAGDRIYYPTSTSRTVTIAQGDTVDVPVEYTLTPPGVLEISITGLPAGVWPLVEVENASAGYYRAVNLPTTLRGLVPGFYDVSAKVVKALGYTFVPGPKARVDVTGSLETARSEIVYSATTGALTVNLTGLSDAPLRETTTQMPVRIVGPQTDTTIDRTVTLADRAPGTYEITATEVNLASGGTQIPSRLSQSLTVLAGQTVDASLRYDSGTTGALTMTIAGLPLDCKLLRVCPPAVTIAGPNGFTQSLGASTRPVKLFKLEPGQYTVTARAYDSLYYGRDLVPSPVKQMLTVPANGTADATVQYGAGIPPGFNLSIARATITQGVQRSDGGVPLVQGRPGLLRVRLLSNTASNRVAVTIRVRVYQGSSLVATHLVSSVNPLNTVDDGPTSNWDLPIPPELMQPSLGIIVDVDPDNDIPETNESDNRYPSSASPLTFDVRSVPPLKLRLVPVIQNSYTTTPDVNAANAQRWLESLRRLYPLDQIDVDVAPPFATTVVAQSDGSGWDEILSEVAKLQALDGGSTYYYGVLRVPYSSETRGLGYIGGRSAIGWDRDLTQVPSRGDGAATVLAHEVGHNFGRLHSPCGTNPIPANPDPAYPYAGGVVGQWGRDVFPPLSGAQLDFGPGTGDVMGYCSSVWVSDYTYRAVMDHRSQTTPSAILAGRRQVLLVSGRVTPAGVALDPAFDIQAYPLEPTILGPYRLEGLDSAGTVLFSYAFAPTTIGDGIAGTTQFVFTLPLSEQVRSRVARLRVSGEGRLVERQPSTVALRASMSKAPAPEPRLRMDREVGSRRLTVRWDATVYPGVIIRDPASGTTLGIGTGGSLVVQPLTDVIDVTYSDGVRSQTRRVVVDDR